MKFKNVQNCLSNTVTWRSFTNADNWLQPQALTAPAGHYLTTKALWMNQ